MRAVTPRRRQRDGDKARLAKVQEQELKRARGAISCAECRRLKLKCDKIIPCSSCTRRGCPSICPNRALATGQGTRFILADTDVLHTTINKMSDRIRQLEDGLGILQSSITREPHPLLAESLCQIKSTHRLHSAADLPPSARDPSAEPGALDDEDAAADARPLADALGTLALRDDGAATFYGRSAGSESLLLDEKPYLTLAPSAHGHPDLPPEVNRYASAFPHGPSDIPAFDLKDIVQGCLPSWSRVARLRDLYLEQAPWFSGAVTRRQLCDELLPFFYAEARADPAYTASGTIGDATGHGAAVASAHELALLCAVLCIGATMDPALHPAPQNGEAHRYYQLCRAALSVEPIMDRPPGVATVQVLVLMGMYQGLVSDEHSVEATWALTGLSAKLAQSAGLHRDCSRFALSPWETQKRRALFWELFICDCWQALATGRPPSFQLQFVDAELPADPHETLDEDGTPQPSFAAWKARWAKECLFSVVMGTLTAEPPRYSDIGDLDRRIRDMPLPKFAQGELPNDPSFCEAMMRFMPHFYIDSSLIYLHRCFFESALIDDPMDPMRSQYLRSFNAGYLSAINLLKTAHELFKLFPSRIARYSVIWSHAFSSCVMLGSVITRCKTSKVNQQALGELREACNMFDGAAAHGGPARKYLHVLKRVHEKAHAAFFRSTQPLHSGIPTSRGAEAEDELLIFSSRTPRTVQTRSHRTERMCPGTSPVLSSSGSDLARPHSSGLNGVDTFPGLGSSYQTAVHTGLAAEFSAFEGHLDAQMHQTAAFHPGPGAHPSTSSPESLQLGSGAAGVQWFDSLAGTEDALSRPSSLSSSSSRAASQRHHPYANPHVGGSRSRSQTRTLTPGQLHHAGSQPSASQQAFMLPTFGGFSAAPSRSQAARAQAQHGQYYAPSAGGGAFEGAPPEMALGGFGYHHAAVPAPGARAEAAGVWSMDAGGPGVGAGAFDVVLGVDAGAPGPGGFDAGAPLMQFGHDHNHNHSHGHGHAQEGGRGAFGGVGAAGLGDVPGMGLPDTWSFMK